MVDQEKIGRYVAERRREMRMTQSELAERLGVSGQAVSKWERGECLPDTGLLLELAAILCTSVDGLLRGGEALLPFRGEIRTADILEGVASFFALPRRIGRDNTLYQGMIEGIERRMNLDWEEDFRGRDERWCIELFAAEIIIQQLGQGRHVELAEVSRLFTQDQWRETVVRYAASYGIR